MKTLAKVCSVLVLGSLFNTGCMSAYKKSVGGETDQVFSKIFLTEYPMAWDAAIDALKASPMEVVNRENGTIQTKWIDNTSERNQIDAAGSVNPYTKAQYRFRVSLAKGVVDSLNSVRVSVQKEQQVQRDVLEGWRNLETDGIQENSLLYRVGKLIEFKTKIEKIENKRLKSSINSQTL